MSFLPQAGSPLGASDSNDPRRSSLISSLRQRFLVAQARNDAAAKQALFQEAVYLNIAPELWQPNGAEPAP
jgi:hypothetical protein